MGPSEWRDAAGNNSLEWPLGYVADAHSPRPSLGGFPRRRRPPPRLPLPILAPARNGAPGGPLRAARGGLASGSPVGRSRDPTPPLRGPRGPCAPDAIDRRSRDARDALRGPEGALPSRCPTMRPLGRPVAPLRGLNGLALRRPVPRLPTRNTASCALAGSLALRPPRAAPSGAPVAVCAAPRGPCLRVIT